MSAEQKRDLVLFINLFGQIDLDTCDFTDVPDLLVPQTGGTLGVEHTRLYREDPALPSGRQRLPQEKLHGQLVERAHQIFREHSSQLLNLTVEFEIPFNYQRNDLEEVAQALAQSVLAVIPRHQAADPSPSFVHQRFIELQVQRFGHT